MFFQSTKPCFSTATFEYHRVSAYAWFPRNISAAPTPKKLQTEPSSDVRRSKSKIEKLCFSWLENLETRKQDILGGIDIV
jgi:hypothetical protein